MKKSFSDSIAVLTLLEAVAPKSLIDDLQRFLIRRQAMWHWIGILTAMTGFCLAAALPAESADKSIRFESQILPIFESRCVACHGADSPQQGLDLRSRAAIIKGGKSGPAIQVGSSEKSLLMEKIITKQMPPLEPKLTQEEIETIRAWIDRGAPAAGGGLSAVPPITEPDVLPIFQARCVHVMASASSKASLTCAHRAQDSKEGSQGRLSYLASPMKA